MIAVSREGFRDQARELEETYLSKWSCRRCTLENPLQEAVCLACGGSRLSSIGDIEVPKIVEPKNLVNLIREEELEDQVVEDTNNNADLARWKCRICTLENEPLSYFCDACNAPNPVQEAKKNRNKEEVVTRADDPNMELGILLSKAVRSVTNTTSLASEERCISVHPIKQYVFIGTWGLHASVSYSSLQSSI